jgi:predicted aldo/keto reductase-like oxidoreductase
MDYLSLGNTGLKVSRLCLGCMSYGSSRRREWILDEEQSFPFFKQAIEAGINFFDTARFRLKIPSNPAASFALFPGKNIAVSSARYKVPLSWTSYH